MRKIYEELLSHINFFYMKAAAIATPFFLMLYTEIMGFYAPVSDMLWLLVLLAATDIVTGVITNVIILKEKFSSKRFWQRKAVVTVLFFLGLTGVLAVDLMLKSIAEPLNSWISKSWILFYGVYELISILENLAKTKKLPLVSRIINVIYGKLPQDVVDVVREEKKDTQPPKQ